jgi:hypothetical protein
MKTKSILFIIAAAILLSFTVISKQSKELPATDTTTVASAETAPAGGFAMEDQNQW